jgi:thiamine pyrophosphokinase
MDSASDILIKKYNNITIQKYPKIKDKTDLEIAIDYSIEKKANDITLLGAYSRDRFDHIMGNIQSLSIAAKAGKNCKMIWMEQNKINCIYISSKYLKIENAKNIKNISILPLENLEISKTIGLAYELKNDKINFPSTRGISNYPIENIIEIYIESGIAMIICN